MSTITRAMSPQSYIRARMYEKGFDGESLRHRMHEEYGIRVSSGHLSEILRGLAQPKHDVLFAMLAVLGLKLDDWGIEPHQAPMAWLALEALRLGLRVPPPEAA